VLRALSLSRNPMPPRTTRQSDRRKVSDRTMVGTAQPLCLSASEPKASLRRHHESLENGKTTEPCYITGLDGKTPCLTVAAEAFLLTSPFIERSSRSVESRESQMTISGAGSSGLGSHDLRLRPSTCRLYRRTDAWLGVNEVREDYGPLLVPPQPR